MAYRYTTASGHKADVRQKTLAKPIRDDMSATEPQPAERKPKRRRLQYSLRTLLVIVTLLSALCSVGTCIGWGVVLSSIGTCIGSVEALTILAAITAGGVIAITRSVQVVRLLAAVSIALAACQFVIWYDGVSRIRFQFDHPGQTLTGCYAGQFVTTYGKYASAVPLAALLMGTLTIWRWPNSHALFEVVVSTLWVLAFIWAGLILVIWQVQNIPIFSGMRWHY
jgi:hypothetical protein